MYKKFVFHYFFVSDKNDNFAIVSTSTEKLLSYQKNLLDSSIKFSETEIFYSNNHKAIKEFINPDNKELFIMKINNVKNEEQLRKVLEIKSNVFEPKTEMEKFLSDNNLLKLWIDGLLIGLAANIYYERSKSFGIRNKYSEKKITFDCFHLIWSLEKEFNGYSNERDGEFAKFHYRNEYRLISLAGKKCNEGWLKKIKEECYL